MLPSGRAFHSSGRKNDTATDSVRSPWTTPKVRERLETLAEGQGAMKTTSCFQLNSTRRTPSIPVSVMSRPIPDEQRHERDAVKKQAQQERQNATHYTSVGKRNFFLERQKDLEVAQHYGYMI